MAQILFSPQYSTHADSPNSPDSRVKILESPTPEVEVEIQYKSWRKIKQFQGKPKITDFRLETGKVRELKENEILTKAVGWPVLLYQKKDIYCPLGAVMIGEQLARVTSSKNKDYPVYTYVLTVQGWTTYSVLDPSINFCQKLPGGFGDLSPVRVMNVLGLTGLMFYFGLAEVCRPKMYDAIVISCDSVFIGAFIAQLAYFHFFCAQDVIIFTRSQAVIGWMKNNGFFLTFNCSVVNPSSILSIHAKNGVDIFIDTIGSSFTEHILEFLSPNTRSLIFGHSKNSFAQYGCEDLEPDPYRFFSFINLIYSSHNVFDYSDQFEAAQHTLLKLLIQGKLKLPFKTDRELDFSTLPLSLKHLCDNNTVEIVNVLDVDDAKQKEIMCSRINSPTL